MKDPLRYHSHAALVLFPVIGERTRECHISFRKSGKTFLLEFAFEGADRMGGCYLGNAYLNYNGVGTLSPENTCLFSAFVYDEDFRETFAARAQEIAEIYTSDAALEILDEMEEEVDTPIQRHVLRWNRTQWNDSFDYSVWKNKLSNTRAVLASRTNCYGIYPNNDYLDRQIEAAFWRYLNDISYYA